MGLCNSPDIFQEKMNELFDGLEYVRAYIDELLIISNGNFEDHLNKVKTVLKKLIMIPKQIQKTLVEWYHNTLCHPGETKTKFTIDQHFHWKGLRKSLHNICCKCRTCQFFFF